MPPPFDDLQSILYIACLAALGVVATHVVGAWLNARKGVSAIADSVVVAMRFIELGNADYMKARFPRLTGASNDLRALIARESLVMAPSYPDCIHECVHTLISVWTQEMRRAVRIQMSDAALLFVLRSAMIDYVIKIIHPELRTAKYATIKCIREAFVKDYNRYLRHCHTISSRN